MFSLSNHLSNLYNKFSKFQVRQDLCNDPETLSIWNHDVILPSNVKILTKKVLWFWLTRSKLWLCTHTLVELAISAMSHPGLVSAVDSVNVITLDLFDLVHGHIASKRNLRECYMKR